MQLVLNLDHLLPFQPSQQLLYFTTSIAFISCLPAFHSFSSLTLQARIFFSHLDSAPKKRKTQIFVIQASLRWPRIKRPHCSRYLHFLNLCCNKRVRYLGIFSALTSIGNIILFCRHRDAVFLILKQLLHSNHSS